MKLTDHELLKHYVGANVTICFLHKEEILTITGKLQSYDCEEMNVKLKESILYEIGLEHIDYYSVKGFDDLKEQDCTNIVRAVHGSYDGWKIESIEKNKIILSNANIDNLLSKYHHAIILTRKDQDCIGVHNVYDPRITKPDNAGMVYTKLLTMGYGIL